MRVLFFLHNVSKSRHFEGILQGLAERGHSVVLAAARQRNRPLSLPKALQLCNRRLIEAGAPGRIEIVPCPVHRVDAWVSLAPTLRLARDYMRFQHPGYAHAAKLAARAADNAPPAWRQLVERSPLMRRRWRTVARMLALAERAIPSDRLFELFMTYERPDVVFVTPIVDYGSYQTDYVKSAHRLGLPIVFMPFSWDNLTNRGLIRVTPDRVLVWNELQKQEAIDFHDVPPDRITVTGAPRFDEFFAMRAATSRDEFCRRQGLDPARPFVLYLCSSEFVAAGEVDFVRRWIGEMRAAADPVVRACGVLVRPHPTQTRPWQHVSFAGGNAARWTDKETMNADQGLFDSITHAAAVVGLNTSAMIEAGIVGRPVHTILTSEFAGGQEQTLHFEYLRASRGGLLHEARTIGEHLEQLSRSLGADPGAAERAPFVERFVRPRGLERPVAPLVVEEIEEAARTIRKRPAATPLWAYPVRWAVLAAAGWWQLASHSAAHRAAAGRPRAGKRLDVGQ